MPQYKVNPFSITQSRMKQSQNSLPLLVISATMLYITSAFSSIPATMGCDSSLRAGTFVMINNPSGQSGYMTSTITFSSAMATAANHAAVGYKTLKSI